MLDSIIIARDKFLSHNGTLWPSYSTIYWSAISFEEDRQDVLEEYEEAQSSFTDFSIQMKEFYQINMDYLEKYYEIENKNYYIYNALWRELKVDHIIGEAIQLQSWNLYDVTLKDSLGLYDIPFIIEIPFHLKKMKTGIIKKVSDNIIVSGFAGWFTVDFDINGDDDSINFQPVTLSTGPEVGYTHWGQQVFYFPKAIACVSGDKLHGHVSIYRQKDNRRIYNIAIRFRKNDEDEELSYIYELS